MTKTDTPLSDLLPDRHPQSDLFICDVADAVLKDFHQDMEHPFFSLSKKPEKDVRRYEHNGNWLEVTPSVHGLATIYDKDILIYCISQIMAKLNRGEQVSQRVKINSHDYLIFTNRGTAGKDYDALCNSLKRLVGTNISTNIRTGDEEQFDTFGLIDAASVKRKFGLDGRLQSVEIKLSDWVFNAIQAKDVLTLNFNYFRLKRPIEKRLYEIARKHCGKQEKWSISLALLHKKSGSRSSLSEFRRSIKPIVKSDHLPDYHTTFDTKNDQVTFSTRKDCLDKNIGIYSLPPLLPTTFEEAKKVAPGLDVYDLEGQWRAYWASSGKPKIHSPSAAFIAFCKKKYKENPSHRR